MSKRTLALVIFLVFITVILLYKALVTVKPPVSPTPIAATPTPVIGHTVLSFFPNPLVLSSSSGNLDVMIDTGGDKVTGVQLKMKYDPDVLTITEKSITPGSFLESPTVLPNSIDQKNGTISYPLFIPLTATGKAGKGTVARISFQANRNVAKQTTIRLLPSSLVTAEGVAPSVLKTVNDAVIIFSETQTQ